MTMAKATREPQRLRDVLGDVGARLGIDRPAETGYLWARWREIVGDAIAAHAEPTSLRNGVLRVRAESPAWATEIGYLSAEIIERVNAALSAEVVREIRTWTGPARSGPERGSASGAPRTDPSVPAPSVVEGTAEPPKDPLTALDRARKAWERRRRKRPSAERLATPETPRKPW